MDLLSHALLGATAAVALASARKLDLGQRRGAAAVGAAAGLLPDMDALIQSGSDALLVLDYHRHFSHALAFVPLGALLAALLLWPLVRRRMGFASIYSYSVLGYLPHLLLDACTSYGTHLWLPFSARKEAWSLIAIVNPLFTLLLAVPLLLALRSGRTGQLAATARWGLLLGIAYLGFGAVQQQRVEQAALAVAQARGHAPGALTVKPTFGNLILWRALYEHDGQLQVDAFHAGGDVRHYPGESAVLLDTAAAVRHAAGEAPRLRDIGRFRVFSEGQIVHDPLHPGRIGDARYAMMPTRIAPIWGIEWQGPQAPTEFVSDHRFSPAMRKEFLTMLQGR